jgi:hypothetical protein
MGRNVNLVKQIEYKNAELVLCEFISLKKYDIDTMERLPRYEDFNLQEFHDFVASKIDDLDKLINNK